MWKGLQSVTELDLSNNDIANLEPDSFSNLSKLIFLYLNINSFSTLSPKIFNPNDFPNSNGHLEKLVLGLQYNGLQCDSRMCWLKHGEQEGWLKFQYRDKFTCGISPEDKDWHLT